MLEERQKAIYSPCRRYYQIILIRKGKEDAVKICEEVRVLCQEVNKNVIYFKFCDVCYKSNF